MCLTMPVRVLSVDGAWAEVEIGAGRRRASALAVPEVRAGDWALLAAGSLVRILDNDLAAEVAAAFHAATITDDMTERETLP
jgi:hydrogenase assembly chaperone HypC/HupF